MANRTFAIIKPDALKNGHLGKIYDRILKAEFIILGAKIIRMSRTQAQGFYSIHINKLFMEYVDHLYVKPIYLESKDGFHLLRQIFPIVLFLHKKMKNFENN